MKETKSMKCIICDNFTSVEVIGDVMGIPVPLNAVPCSDKCKNEYDAKIELEDRTDAYRKTLQAFPKDNIDSRLKEFKEVDISLMGKTYNAHFMAKCFSENEFWFMGIVGTTGTGKSRYGLSLLSSLAFKGKTKTNKRRISDAHSIGYYKAYEINNIVKNEAEKVHQIETRMFETCRVLMIDELKARKDMPFKDSSAIEHILETRHGNGLKTILTSNLLLEEFEAEYPAIFSRCAQGLFELNGTDRRR